MTPEVEIHEKYGMSLIEKTYRLMHLSLAVKEWNRAWHRDNPIGDIWLGFNLKREKRKVNEY